MFAPGSSTGPFTVHIECTSIGPSGPIPLPPQDIVFNGPGSLDSNVFSYEFFGSCTITETVTAGATSVTVSCVDPAPGGVACSGPGPSLTVQAPPSPGTILVGIRVVNDFGPPTTTTTPPIDPNASVNAGAVAAAPDFTG